MEKPAKAVGVGAATGAVAATGTWAVVGATGTASTGTGAAKRAAVLAVLGGPVGWLALGVGSAVAGGLTYAAVTRRK